MSSCPDDESPASPIASRQWLIRAKEGSAEALGRLLEAFRPYLLTVANEELPLRLQAKVGASDLVQDAFVEAQRAFPSFAGEDVSVFKAWLRQILLHQQQHTIRHFAAGKRATNREQALADEPWKGAVVDQLAASGPSPSSVVVREETQARLETQLESLDRAIRELPEKQQQVILLRYQHGWTLRRIAEFLNCSEPAVRRLWSSSVDRLTELLGATCDNGC